MARMLNLTREEILAPSQREADRMTAQEHASTRRMYEYERAARQRKANCDRAIKQFGIELAPLGEHEDYAKLAATHLRIGTRQAELDRELVETNTSLARGMSAYNKNQVEHQAQAVIDGDESGAFQGFEELRSRQARLESELRSHAEALGTIRAKMLAMRSERSIDAAEAVRPAHRSVAAAIAEACVTLREALQMETAIHDILKEAGFDDRLRNLQGISDVAELESRAWELAQ